MGTLLTSTSTGNTQTIQIFIDLGWQNGVKIWTVHPGLVLRSKYLRNLWDTRLKCGDIISLALPGRTDVENTDLYVGFVLKSIARASVKPAINSVEAILQSYEDLSRIYIFAKDDKLGDKETRNDVIKAMVDLSKIVSKKGYSIPPPGKVVQKLYGATPQGHIVRKLLVDIWTYVDHELVDKNFAQFPKDFAVDLMVALLQQPAVATPTFMKQALLEALKNSGGTKNIPRIVETGDRYLEK